MAVKIRLKRLGKIRAPYYRVVVADSRTKRDGRSIEEIGKYHPTQEPSLIEIDSERAQYWLGVGAQPTEQVLALLKITGDWQKHKGLPGTEGTLRTAAARWRGKDVVVIGVDGTDLASAARRYMSHYDVNYPVVRDADGSQGRHWGVTAFPETFFVDRNGKVIPPHVDGPIPAGTLNTTIRQALRS